MISDSLRCAIQSLAGKMPAIPHAFDAGSFQIEWTSSSVVWPDELPDVQLSPSQSEAVKSVLRHRTSIIIGIDLDDGLAQIWQLATQIFPEWIGFRAERMKLEESKIDDYKAQCAEMRKQIMELFEGSGPE